MKSLHGSRVVRGGILFSVLLAACMSASAQQIPEAAYGDMKWRFVGPQRAGWATVAEGIPDHPNTFYFGAVGGGVWKTMDAGLTWTGLMQNERSSSVGALAIAPSNPNIIYVGTGQVAYRYDILSGDGVYRSDDGGMTWRNIGLPESHHVGRILVDPRNPDRVLVAALGHVFGPNAERGVFLTNDGGRSWKHVLSVDDRTGAVDLSFDPLLPSVVYAAAWQVRMRPWLDYFVDQFYPGSGIYKSTDGGEHWARLKGNGLPEGNLGRIGLSVARGSKGQILYATVEGPDTIGGLYRSRDGGLHWDYMNHDGALGSSYFGRVTVDPKDPETVYVMGRSIGRSTDGGMHFTLIKGAPGGDDYHFLWINPLDPGYMITGSDQGAAVTVNGGLSWSNWYNQPTGQFYHVAVDDRFPYRIYGSQQDNGTVQILSRGPYGVIDERDWHPVGADERDFVIPKPGNPEMVFGSGLGGSLSRFDEVTRQSAQISPWPISSYGARLNTVKYRYTWITPIAVSPIEPFPLYFGAQFLFRSPDDGNTWEIVSPDLTGKTDDAGPCQDPDPAQAIACGYGVIYEIAPSPVDANVLWVGTDNGLIQLTTNGCKDWINVTPKEIPQWARIDAIAPSHFDARRAYAAVNLKRLDRLTPLIMRTTDSGASWVTISDGIPGDECVYVVAEDPVRPGLLFAGTNRGAYVSFDDGSSWQALSLNLPTTSVRDMMVHQGDLIAATNGRGIWILDNIAPLRELTRETAQEPAYLFQPAPAWRMRGNENRDTPWPPSTPLAQNPPSGATIDYWLREDTKGPVRITILDADGREVRTFSSDDAPEVLNAEQYFEEGWLEPSEALRSEAGMHRFVWDLRYPRPASLSYSYTIAGVWKHGTPVEPEGPLVLPGNYTVVLTANGRRHEKPLEVALDPRVHVSRPDLEAQLALADSVIGALGAGVDAHKTIERIRSEHRVPLAADLADSLSALAGGLGLQSVCGSLKDLLVAILSADAVPTQGQRDAFSHYQKELAARLDRWKAIEAKLPDQQQ